MELRTCEFCGTEYNFNEQKCPNCGRSGKEDANKHSGKKQRRVAASGGGARVAGKKQKKQNKLGWGIACAVLGAAVLAGIVYFFSIMDFFDPDFDFNAIPTLIEQGAPVEEDLSIHHQPEEEEAKPEEEVQEEQPEVVLNGKSCTGLTISQTAVTLDEQGSRIFLTAVARPMDCEDPIVFASTNESVVSVTENGMITAIGPGVADIVVTCGTIIQTCTITCEFEEEVVEEEPETTDKEPVAEEENTDEIALNKVDFTLFYPGEETKLEVKNAPDGATITYVSSDITVVTVDEKGNVTAEGDGDATITVTVGDVKLTCIARCRMDATTEGGASGSYTGPFKLSHEDVTLFSNGEVFTLTLLDATGKKVSNVSWSASNGCVSISGNTIKAAATGQTTVSCVYEGKTYKCIVRCNF